jgi:hypothetical protein
MFRPLPTRSPSLLGDMSPKGPSDDATRYRAYKHVASSIMGICPMPMQCCACLSIALLSGTWAGWWVNAKEDEELLASISGHMLATAASGEEREVGSTDVGRGTSWYADYFISLCTELSIADGCMVMSRSSHPDARIQAESSAQPCARQTSRTPSPSKTGNHSNCSFPLPPPIPS